MELGYSSAWDSKPGDTQRRGELKLCTSLKYHKVGGDWSIWHKCCDTLMSEYICNKRSCSIKETRGSKFPHATKDMPKGTVVPENILYLVEEKPVVGF